MVLQLSRYSYYQVLPGHCSVVISPLIAYQVMPGPDCYSRCTGCRLHAICFPPTLAMSSLRETATEAGIRREQDVVKWWVGTASKHQRLFC